MTNSIQTPIYLDYSATTPVDKRVAKKMIKYLTTEGDFGNPASRSHKFGWVAESAIEKARFQIADLIGASSSEIVFTSGSTESNNLAIKGIAEFYQSKGNHIITAKTEHKAVLDPCRDLETRGFQVTYLDVGSDGLIDVNELEKAMTDKTILVSIMHANNEIGVIQDIEAIAHLCRSKGIFFHTDATQSVGKIDIDVNKSSIDLMSINAHKMYGPKGIGALFVRRKPRVRLRAQILGGGHERGMRSGTLATHQIVGFGHACKIAKKEMHLEQAKCLELRNHLLKELQGLSEVQVNGSLTHRLSNNLNISFNYIEGESLMMAIKDLAVSSGSACTSASLEPSYVLRALGLKDEIAHSSIRFSVGRFTTKEEIDYAIEIIKKGVTKLRALSPLWEMHQKGVDLDTIKWASH